MTQDGFFNRLSGTFDANDFNNAKLLADALLDAGCLRNLRLESSFYRVGNNFKVRLEDEVLSFEKDATLSLRTLELVCGY